MPRSVKSFFSQQEPSTTEGRTFVTGPNPGAFDAALALISEGECEVEERPVAPRHDCCPPSPLDPLREVFELCRQEMARRGIETSPAYRRRVRFELEAIAEGGHQAELLSLARSGQMVPNPQNMLVLDLLGVGGPSDPTLPPTFAVRDVESICVPPSGSATDLLARFGILQPPIAPSAVTPPPSPFLSRPTLSPPRAEQKSEPRRESRRGDPMRGMELLREARRRQAEVEAQVVRMAQGAAHRIADTLGQDIDFQAIRAEYGGTLYAATRAKDGWALAVVCDETFRLHSSWTYEDSRRFGLHVRDGLVERMAEVLNDRVDEVDAAFGDFGVTDDEEDSSLQAVDDEQIITALLASHDDIPMMLSQHDR